MAELSTVRPPPPADTYRPLSLLAVVGLVIGIVSISIYLFEAGWLAILPILGFIISGVASYRIKHSEGTLAGAKLATFALGLNLVIGLSWITVQITTALVIRHESAAFADQWMENLCEEREALAFLASVRPHSRPDEIKAEDLDPRVLKARYPSPNGPAVDLFRMAPIPEMVLRAGKQAEWKRLYVEETIYHQGAYIIKHRYHLKTPELEGDMVVMTKSDVAMHETGPRREWMIEVGACKLVGETVKSTDFGEELHEAKSEGTKALNLWIAKIGIARRDEALAAVDSSPRVREEFERVYTALRQNATSPRASVTLTGRQPLLLKGWKEGKGWRMLFRVVIETGPREAELELTMQADTLERGMAGWRVADIRFLGERKKTDPLEGAGAPSPPQIQQPPPKSPIAP